MSKSPMLASPVNLASLRYPVSVSPKLDGIRMLCDNSFATIGLSRAMKPFPNVHLNQLLMEAELDGQSLHGLDGELIVGDPMAPDVFNTTQSVIMSKNSTQPFTFWVFDDWTSSSEALFRRSSIHNRKEVGLLPSWVKVLEHFTCHDEAQLLRLEAQALDEGYEGLMIRSFRPMRKGQINHAYKWGRSTDKEQLLLKLKRFSDDEATIIDVEELQRNLNTPLPNERGLIQRSSHAAGLVSGNCLGALVVKVITGPFTGATVSIGSGFTEYQRDMFWRHSATLLGRTITFKYLKHGAKDAPRHPVFKGFRQEFDL